MRIKAKDIARELNLSEATVSLALNDKPGVKAETKKRVLDYVNQAYGSMANASAQNTEQPSKGTILMLNYIRHGIIMERESSIAPEEDASPFYKEIRSIVEAAGYDFWNLRYYAKSKDMQKLLLECKKRNVRGIYFMAAEMLPSDIFPFLDLQIPLVTGDNLFYEAGADSFLIDNKEGICRAVDYLVDKGHSRILYLAEDIDIYNFRERREAFVEEMRRRNCGNADNCIQQMGSSVEDVYDTMGRYLDKGVHRTTAFVLESSVVSLGVIKAMLERNVRIPRDYSLLGFDALPAESIRGISLTLVKGTHTMRHKAAMRHLLRRIEGESEEIMRVYYKTRLIEGDTVFDKTKYIYTK